MSFMRYVCSNYCCTATSLPNCLHTASWIITYWYDYFVCFDWSFTYLFLTSQLFFFLMHMDIVLKIHLQLSD